MPSAIVATSGAATANSFVTEAEAITYLDNRINASAWNDEAPGSDSRLRALLEAARDLNLAPWAGSPTDSTQAMAWPREYVVNPDIPWASVEQADTYYYSNTVIPQRVKDAQCELALEYLKAGTKDLAVRDTELDVKRKKTDVLEKEFFAPSQRAQGWVKFPRVLQLLGPLLDEARIGAMKVIRV